MHPGFHEFIGEYRQLAPHGLAPPWPSLVCKTPCAMAAYGLLHRGNIIAAAGVTSMSVTALRRHFEVLPSRLDSL